MKDIEVEIPADILEKLERLPTIKSSTRINFTPAMDAALLKYWPTKNHDDVAAALGICNMTALKRYRKLTGGGNG